MNPFSAELSAGRLLPIQIQLAAALGHRDARRAKLPGLPLRRPLLQCLSGHHQQLPPSVRRVLRAATRRADWGLPPSVSIRWGAECATRTLAVAQRVLPAEERPARALETVRVWLDSGSGAEHCSAAAHDANSAVQDFRDASIGKAARRPGPIGLCFPAEAAAYAAHEAALAVLAPQPEATPRWVLRDHPSIRAGHAACWANTAADDRKAEVSWQTNRLIELILGSPPEAWT